VSTFGGYEHSAIVAECYDLVYEYVSRRDVDFFVEIAKSVSGPTLELGCGTGRVLIPTAQAGCEITGLDLSEHMIAVCRRKLADQTDDVQSRAKLVQGNMTDFDLGNGFGLVTIPFRRFQHLIDVETKAWRKAAS